MGSAKYSVSTNIKVTLPCIVISIPKHSFCNTVCICMVMQIKLVVVVVDQEIIVPRFIDEVSSRIRDRVKWSRKRFQGR